ncbi:thiamine phosphate synthase [Bosea sp. PAMC 26642]|uniref:thiamine phosphate synthase n=1 Tax=Bosea sp. (strain PAMC 26642) TaxID=1792307 RepID=UPI0007706964|nr:thiamine phosphate synthase [Bosea sp. PAMC 26642]AMJ62257.1 thiamine-phosphate pyrophosphorylase [Bosea sp. PAMC 26642]
MILDILLYGIIDPQIAQGRPLADLARAAALGGATLIQYRAKEASTREMVREARAIRAALAGTAVPLLINDRIDVALAAGAEGVHLGADDMDLADARRLLGEDAIIGATLKNAGELPYLASARIDYACIGGVFPTQHKDNAGAPLGLDGFYALRDAARRGLGTLPIGAIAGITAANAASVMAAGADGIAVIGSMFGGDDVTAATRSLRAALRVSADPGRGRPSST